MKEGSKVEFVGDQHGHNSSLTIPSHVGQKGILGESPMVGFWWVKLPCGEEILAAETELKELSEVP